MRTENSVSEEKKVLFFKIFQDYKSKFEERLRNKFPIYENIESISKDGLKKEIYSYLLVQTVNHSIKELPINTNGFFHVQIGELFDYVVAEESVLEGLRARDLKKELKLFNQACLGNGVEDNLTPDIKASICSYFNRNKQNLIRRLLKKI